MRKGYKDNNKKISRELNVSVSVTILLFHFLYPNVGTLYLSYSVVITLMNYSPFFICNGLKCCLLTMHQLPPQINVKRMSEFFTL
jgi:hypothetical protein